MEDYNEKEKYWINFYNSLTPNGYNILSGGDEPPILKGEDRLKDLIAKCEDLIYNITGIDVADKQKMIDLLFKKAYHLDDTTYANILNTFPKY